MGFKEAKRLVLAALGNGSFLIESRTNIATKNLLAMGIVSATDLIDIIGKCNGSHHSCSPHHADASIDVHVLLRDGWYIKFYVVEPDVVFISVHK